MFTHGQNSAAGWCARQATLYVAVMCGPCAYKLIWRKSRRFTTLGPPPHNFQMRYTTITRPQISTTSSATMKSACSCDAMGFYQDQIVPLLINWSMRQKNLAAYRARIIPAAEGRVLEIGIGSGLNLPFYSRNVTHVIGLEPSPRLLAMARRAERTGNGSVE